MRAVVTLGYGALPIVTELDTPTVGPGEVRVKVRSSSLNGFDIALVRGFFRGIIEHEFPVVLGRDFAGTVDQVGDGVTAFAPGDEVFGVVLTQPLRAGGFGEYVVVPEHHSIARLPAGLDHATAGVLGLAGTAAITAVDHVGARAGDTVLVAGATGGVGAIAMQLLTATGAVVVATASGGTETEHVRRLGAAHVVDYRADLAAAVREFAPGGVAAVIHCAGDPVALAELVAAGGRFVSLLGIDPAMFAGRDLQAHSVAAAPARATLESLGGDAAAGRLTVPIQRSYRLDQVPEAFADFTTGTLGKLAATLD
jgi:NADPH:quinone reductase-like Zn-dependent oxidoreductase